MKEPTKTNRASHELLNVAREKKLIVQFSRPFESGTMTGFVMDIGLRFFMLALLDDGFQFSNYVCLRVKDVRKLECPAKREALYKQARQLRGDKMPKRNKLDLTNAASILHSASPSLLTVFFEIDQPEMCHIGYGLSNDRKWFEMLDISPDAKWSSKPSYLRLKKITRIDLPGLYERTLLLVGGDPEY